MSDVSPEAPRPEGEAAPQSNPTPSPSPNTEPTPAPAAAPSAPSTTPTAGATAGGGAPESPAPKPRRVQIGRTGVVSGRAEPGYTETDRAIDAEMEQAMSAMPSSGFGTGSKPLKRQWDDELEAELQAALEGFDAKELESSAKRGPRRGDAAGGGSGGSRLVKVIAARGDAVFVDLGGKSEGIIPVAQFQELNRPIPAAGDLVEALPDRFDPSQGVMKLNLKGAVVEADWSNLKPGTVIEVRVTKTNKGGLDVEVNGIRGFLPISQVDLNRVEDGSEFLNQWLKVVVTEANERLKNLVVSRRQLLEQEREAIRAKTWAEIEEGQVRTGTVRSIKEFGAFVDIGGVDGLVHVSDVSWTRGANAKDFFKVGQELQVKILKIDRELGKVSLGMKQLLPSPWDDIHERYDVGDLAKGKVTRIMDFGAFVELEPGLEGLIHISEISRQRVNRVKDHLQEGQDVDVKILKIDTSARKIALSLREALEELAGAGEDGDSETAAEAGSGTSEGASDAASGSASAGAEAPKPERKVPLKGGLGRSGNLFGDPR